MYLKRCLSMYQYLHACINIYMYVCHVHFCFSRIPSHPSLSNSCAFFLFTRLTSLAQSDARSTFRIKWIVGYGARCMALSGSGSPFGNKLPSASNISQSIGTYCSLPSSSNRTLTLRFPKLDPSAFIILANCTSWLFSKPHMPL